MGALVKYNWKGERKIRGKERVILILGMGKGGKR